jgi:hypothetical protein
MNKSIATHLLAVTILLSTTCVVSAGSEITEMDMSRGDHVMP